MGEVEHTFGDYNTGTHTDRGRFSWSEVNEIHILNLVIARALNVKFR